MTAGAAQGRPRVRVGLTLPSFTTDPAVVLAIAESADRAGLDAVFAYDHLFRLARDGAHRPALECFGLLADVATHTTRIAVGSLVVRTSLRPPAVAAAALATLERLAPGRMIAGLGAGDHESEIEHQEYGIAFPTLPQRIAALRATAVAVRDRTPNTPVWIGGRHRLVRGVVAAADAWNLWGATPRLFATLAADVRVQAPSAELTWGGLVVLGDTDAEAARRADTLGAPSGSIIGDPDTAARLLRAYVDAGATTLVLGPVDSANPANVALAAAVRALLQQ